MGAKSPCILVSINDPDQLMDLVCLACSIAGSDRHVAVHALHVVVMPRALPLDADSKDDAAFGEALLAKAEEVAEERFGRRIHTDLLQARDAGPAIVEEVHEKGIGAVVLGFRRHRGFGERMVGATADYVMKHAPCRVVINVPAEPGGNGGAEGTP